MELSGVKKRKVCKCSFYCMFMCSSISKLSKAKQTKNPHKCVCAPLSVVNQLVLGALRDWCNWAPNLSHFWNRGNCTEHQPYCLIFVELTSLNVTCKNCKHHHNPDRNGVTDCRLWAGDTLSSRRHVGDQELRCVFTHFCTKAAISWTEQVCTLETNQYM